MADAFAWKIDVIERIDRLTTVAESRRSASLREIDRRRAVLSERLRRSGQEIEDREFKGKFAGLASFNGNQKRLRTVYDSGKIKACQKH